MKRKADGGEDAIELLASLGSVWRQAVEDLLFFNPRQVLFQRKILAAIHAFGVPRLWVRDDRLVVEVADGKEIGAFFAVDQTRPTPLLAGVILFARKENALLCLHLSVADAYTASGPMSSLFVAARLLTAAQRLGSRIAGVDHVGVYYQRSGWCCLPLRLRLF